MAALLLLALLRHLLLLLLLLLLLGMPTQLVAVEQTATVCSSNGLRRQLVHQQQLLQQLVSTMEVQLWPHTALLLAFPRPQHLPDPLCSSSSSNGISSSSSGSSRLAPGHHSKAGRGVVGTLLEAMLLHLSLFNSSSLLG
jgi:hypothetical protein